MSLIKVANKNDIKDGEMIKVSVKDKEILLANLNGEFFAINDICTHRHCNLSDGFLEGSEVTCPCHMAKFDVKTGNVTAPPATENEETYPVEIKGNDIFVDV